MNSLCQFIETIKVYWKKNKREDYRSGKKKEGGVGERSDSSCHSAELVLPRGGEGSCVNTWKLENAAISRLHLGFPLQFETSTNRVGAEEELSSILKHVVKAWASWGGGTKTNCSCYFVVFIK